MKRASLWRISVVTVPEAEDAVAELLGAILGLSASTYYDIKTGVNTVTVYLPRKLHLSRKVRKEIAAGLRQIKRCGLKIGPGKIVITKVRREDWAESWKRHFKPISIGGALLVKPSWSKLKPRKGQAVIILDPGLSFGTGHHPTTAFCLREIVKHRAFGKASLSQSVGPDGSTSHPCLKSLSFLDLGTGSGILAIAAVKLGYSPVHAMDLNPEVVRVARANARANRVLHKLTIRQGDVTKLPICPRQQGQGYGLVCANLTADLLVSERRRIAAQLNRSGTLVLAGILKSEFAAVQRVYQPLGLRLKSSRGQGEWRSGSFRFQPKKNSLNGQITWPV